MSVLAPPAPVPETGTVDFDRFQDIRAARQPVVMRGLAAGWPGVAAEKYFQAPSVPWP